MSPHPEELYAAFLTTGNVIIAPVASLSDVHWNLKAYFYFTGISIGSGVASTVGFSIPGSLYKTGDIMNTDTAIAMAIFNFILTLMIAGRIWWIASSAQKLIGKSISPQYKTIVGIIIESGIIYPVGLLSAIIVELVFDAGDEDPSPVYPQGMATQLAGLAPTLIIVRAAYRK
ncbi:hypothetical protein V5O48_016931 [Marasmius crinis-equi]|uniref:Uncharacterized protein n=1 Tax=Marasmius crinis-equi TaxID=585013 RepID=A0ABR3EQE5_9AGAR